MRPTFQLKMSSLLSCRKISEGPSSILCEGTWADLNVDPFLLRKSLVFVLEDPRGHVDSEDGVQFNESREVE